MRLHQAMREFPETWHEGFICKQAHWFSFHEDGFCVGCGEDLSRVYTHVSGVLQLVPTGHVSFPYAGLPESSFSKITKLKLNSEERWKLERGWSAAIDGV
jgi:hypothetical protein